MKLPSHASQLREPPIRRVHWIRSNGFLLGLAVAVLLAFLFPEPGSRSGSLHPDLINNCGIALILFLQGLSLALEEVKSGAGNWRLHMVIQAFTFVAFPLTGLLLDAVLRHVWPEEPQGIRAGLLFLCFLPSTVSTSVVLTSVAGGNTSGALFNAALSNIAGVFITPFLVHFLMRASGGFTPFGPILGQIMLLTLLPFGAGMLSRPWVKDWVDSRKRWVSRISNGVILFIVYAAFCESVQERTWEKYGAILTAQAGALSLVLFAWMSLLIYAAVRVLRLSREDAIAAYFCSVKKTLAMGVPLAVVIFGQREDLPLILLPVMFYHPLQLLINGMLANFWAAHAAGLEERSSSFPQDGQ